MELGKCKGRRKIGKNVRIAIGLGFREYSGRKHDPRLKEYLEKGRGNNVVLYQKLPDFASERGKGAILGFFIPLGGVIPAERRRYNLSRKFKERFDPNMSPEEIRDLAYRIFMEEIEDKNRENEAEQPKVTAQS